MKKNTTNSYRGGFLTALAVDRINLFKTYIDLIEFNLDGSNWPLSSDDYLNRYIEEVYEHLEDLQMIFPLLSKIQQKGSITDKEMETLIQENNIKHLNFTDEIPDS